MIDNHLESAKGPKNLCDPKYLHWTPQAFDDSGIIIGYIAGVLFQYFGDRSQIIWLYVLNACMVGVDLALTLKYTERN